MNAPLIGMEKDMNKTFAHETPGGLLGANKMMEVNRN
jgi:hypothetical protein